MASLVSNLESTLPPGEMDGARGMNEFCSYEQLGHYLISLFS